MILRVPNDLDERVQPLLATPYLPNGETPDGWDCAGLGRWCLINLCGLEAVEALPEYPSEILGPRGGAERSRRIGEVLRRWREVEPQPGVLGWLEWLGGATHVGFLIAPRTVLHADAGTGTTLMDLDRPGARWRLKAAFVPADVAAVVHA